MTQIKSKSQQTVPYEALVRSLECDNWDLKFLDYKPMKIQHFQRHYQAKGYKKWQILLL